MSTSAAMASGTEEENKLSSIAERFCRPFSLSKIQLATENFSYSRLIGNGGSGEVYKGLIDIDGGRETVAIKRLKPNSNKGAPNFLTEIETLMKVRHVNLVSLIGYCCENGERIIVFEYIARGTLADHLYKLSRNTNGDSFSSLTWKQRLNICIEAGQGLAYLHTGTSIIHRDVKSTNILLDENLRAKVSDFGLAKHLTAGNSITHVTTDVKGTFGYVDPSYFNTHRLTKESDTYAFGVVLLEVLCGRAAVDLSLPEDEISLVLWAKEKIRKGKVDQIVASNLKKEISSGCLKTFVDIAKRCLDESKDRPRMDEVVAKLKDAFEQQERKSAKHNALRFQILSPFWNKVRPSGYGATGLTKKDKKQVDVKTLSATISTTQQEELMVEKEDEQNVGSYVTGSPKKDEKQVDVKMLSATASTTQEEALMVEKEDEQNVGSYPTGSTKNDEKQVDVKTLSATISTTPKETQPYRKKDPNPPLISPRKDNIVNHGATNQAYFVLGRNTGNIQDLYKLSRKLGQGQFEATYACTEISSGIEYACKSISKGKLTSKEDVEDVRREIQIMHHLAGHNNIVTIKGAYEDPLYVYIVMELCTGGDLFDSIRHRGHYSERKAAQLTKIIVGVVEACHSLGVMHRNLKPQNFLLVNKDDDFSLKAIDFGYAVFFQPGKIFTDVVGSPYYVAPEVLLKHYGPEADVWSAGVILYILLSGVPPFWAETQQGIFDAVLEGQIDFDSDPWPLISESAKDLIRKMLCMRPSDRLTAHEVLCHPWICGNGDAPDRALDPTVLSRLKQFSAMNKLKRMALRVIAERLLEEEIAGLKEMFKAMDTDNSGAITFDELKAGLRKYGSTLKDTEIVDLMAAADMDNSGTIDYGEFIAATIHLNKLEREDLLFAAFSYFDKDGSGYITLDELQQACVEYGMDDVFVEDIIKEVDQDNDGRIDYGEFIAMVTKENGGVGRRNMRNSYCHPWICENGVAHDRALDATVLSRLKQFSAMHKLKRMALRVIAESLSEEEIAGLTDMFKAMDTDNSGTLTFDELKAELRKYGQPLRIPKFEI